jgi:hypothetical protein
MEVIRYRKKTVFGTTAFLVAMAAVFTLYNRPAEAVMLKAKITMTQEKIPRKISEKELIAFVKKHQTKRLEETKESNVKERMWKADVLILFNYPIDALEFDLVFYDIQKGVRIMVERRSTLLNKRDQKTYLERIKLRRPQYKPNRKMELTVEVKRAEVGRFKFTIAGE